MSVKSPLIIVFTLYHKSIIFSIVILTKFNIINGAIYTKTL